MKIEIKSWMTGAVLFEGDFSCLADAVKAAVAKGANLSSANLSSADLSSADLSSANLSSANLSSADLSSADLSYANLSSADLRYADLSYANLSSADLSYADLSYANLRSADLRYANLSSANLSSADLSSADLSSANLSSANLSSADLSSAENSAYAIACTRILPEGNIIGWKKCVGGVLVKLLIPTEAKRSHAFGRKCRAEFVRVLEVIGADSASSHYAPSVIYKAGETVRCDKWCNDFTRECGGGIHFFITREEAQEYSL